MDALSVLMYVTVAVLGLVAGSFFNVVICRYISGESILRPASRCLSCLTSLKPKDLVPIVSYLALRGKCRYCGAKLSRRYPLVEASSSGLFLLCYHYFELSPQLVQYAVIFSLLLIISVIDIESHIIPNRLVLILFAWVLLWQLLFPTITPVSALGGFFTGGILFFAIALLSKGGMGGGDVKLMAVLGFATGVPYVFFVFLLAFISGAVVGILLMIFKKKTRKSPIAFGPFLSLAFFWMAIWGEQIWSWYFSFT